MDNFIFIMSFDIQDKTGASIISRHFPNAVQYPVTETDVRAFSFLIAKGILEMCSTHLRALFFPGEATVQGLDSEMAKLCMSLPELPQSVLKQRETVHSRVRVEGRAGSSAILSEDEGLLEEKHVALTRHWLVGRACYSFLTQIQNLPGDRHPENHKKP